MTGGWYRIGAHDLHRLDGRPSATDSADGLLPIASRAG